MIRPTKPNRLASLAALLGTLALLSLAPRDAAAAPPVAVDDAYLTSEGGTLSVASPPLGVLVNDSDPDQDPITAILLTLPAHGSLALDASGTFVYIHDGSETTSDSFTYAASDGTLPSNSATVTITIDPVNDDPVAAPDAVTLLHDTSVDVPVLANDSDVDGPGLLFPLIRAQPAHGTAQANEDGTVGYTPAAGFIGRDSFTYVAMDGFEATSAEVTVSIAVAAAPPRLGVRANGGAAADVVSGERLVVELALDCGDWCGTDADWWVWADTPAGPISWTFAGGVWSPGVQVAARGPLAALAGTVALDSTTLADGGYQFHFSLDAPDGVQDPSPAWSASAAVTVGNGFFQDFEGGSAGRFVPDASQLWKVAALVPGNAQHGRRVYRLKAAGNQRVFLTRTNAAFADFSFAADVRLAGGGRESSSRGMGLFFRGGRGYGSGYVFHINARGNFCIFKRVGGATRRLGTVPLRWFRSEAIRTGRGVWNRLEVVCAGDRITFRVNGAVVREARDASFARGRVGLKAFADGVNAERVEFDNVTLRATPID